MTADPLEAETLRYVGHISSCDINMIGELEMMILLVLASHISGTSALCQSRSLQLELRSCIVMCRCALLELNC
jgi:hypothetical protein